MIRDIGRAFAIVVALLILVAEVQRYDEGLDIETMVDVQITRPAPANNNDF